MPSSRPKRPAAPARSRRTVRKAPTENVARPRAVVDLLEDIQAEFEEAGAHLVQQGEFPSIRLTPVRMLGVERVVAGSLGWGCELRVAPDPLSETSRNGGDRSAGWVYLIVTPGGEFRELDPEGTSPLQGLSWGELAYAAACAGIPNSVVAATSSDEESTPLLIRFAEGLRTELEAD